MGFVARASGGNRRRALFEPARRFTRESTRVRARRRHRRACWHVSSHDFRRNHRVRGRREECVSIPAPHRRCGRKFGVATIWGESLRGTTRALEDSIFARQAAESAPGRLHHSLRCVRARRRRFQGDRKSECDRRSFGPNDAQRIPDSQRERQTRHRRHPSQATARALISPSVRGESRPRARVELISHGRRSRRRLRARRPNARRRRFASRRRVLRRAHQSHARLPSSFEQFSSRSSRRVFYHRSTRSHRRRARASLRSGRLHGVISRLHRRRRARERRVRPLHSSQSSPSVRRRRRHRRHSRHHHSSRFVRRRGICRSLASSLRFVFFDFVVTPPRDSRNPSVRASPRRGVS